MVRLLEGHGHSAFLDSLYERMHSLIYSICPPRNSFRFSCPGGILEDIPLDWRHKCLDTLSTLEKQLLSWKKVMLHSVTLKERMLKDHLSGRDALELGLAGPVLRACGINYDIRKTNPYYFYNQVDFEIPLGLHGSAYDRFLVRMEEIYQSARIIYQLLDNLPAGESLSSELLGRDWNAFFSSQNPTEEEIYFCHEGPSGELGYYLRTHHRGLIHHLKIHTPSFHHAQAYEKLVIGSDVDDSSLIQSSFNFTLSEVER